MLKYDIAGRKTDLFLKQGILQKILKISFIDNCIFFKKLLAQI